MRILIVEDYTPLRNSLSQGLTEAGFAVDATGDGEEGLWFADTSHYDAIILDLMLPGMDGLTILAKLRGKKNATPVLILTAKDAISDRVRGLDSGADDYVTKPFDFAELLARINALIRRRYDHESPVLTLADLAIDTRARSVTRAGKEIELTAKEYMLLEYLVLRRGQVVTRSEIMEHVYDFNADLMSNVIDVRIRTLRRKLECGGLSRLIHTRRGLGYLLAESS